MTAAGVGPPSRVRLGIVGLGSVFEPYATLIRKLRYEGRVEVVATCDVVEGRGRRVHDFMHQDAPFSTDYADVVGRDDVDAVLVLTARARCGWSGPTWGRWYYDTGGGPLFDLGVYHITSLTGLMGSVQRVAALAGAAVSRREVDGESIEVKNFDNYQVLLDFGDARFAVVTTGFTMHEYRSPAIELYGTGGVAQMLGDDWASQGYEIVRVDSAGWTTYVDVDPAWPWTAGLRHLVDCVLDDVELLIRPEHAYHCLEVMVKAQAAASSGETQEVSSRIGPTPTPSTSSAAARPATTTASAATATTSPALHAW